MGRIVPMVIALIGAYWAYQGWFKYGVWVNKGPGGGFLPFVAGVLTTVLCCVESAKSAKQSGEKAAKIQAKQWLPVAATIVMIAVFQVCGMIVTFGLFVIAWLLFFERYPIHRAAFIGVSATAVIYLVFRFFLQVPFPAGYLGI
ncbi:tripartite tricarboxylate transporter TctB family protein [Paenibacillus xerothermodurans]|uniref:tripartite tricarboxylate transporter TctB family protein n=1 Tax=Paenibacillus xerothermodurans TaxID=1977292 RepID=UPI0014022D12|nr:tripartite tricarboxylate transporter TctB family protein [Paenibacillus xerothermodurans]